MKKIISLGLASAVCALTAIAASADVAKYTTEGESVNGATVKVTVTAAADQNIPSFVVSADGFEVVDVKGTGMSSYNAETKKFAMLGNVKAGDTIATITLKITAEGGKKATMTLKDAEDRVQYEAYELEVKGATSEESKPAESTSKEESKPADDKTDDTTNPGTGVALAVVPAVLAAAGVVVAKKRK